MDDIIMELRLLVKRILWDSPPKWAINPGGLGFEMKKLHVNLGIGTKVPGHAMKAKDNPPAGTVIGKALSRLEEEVGKKKNRLT